MHICRHCGENLTAPFLDLGNAPFSNAYLSEKQLSEPEIFYPLRLSCCESCWLVQTVDEISPQVLFSPDYAYFSSTSHGFLRHAESYCRNVVKRLSLNSLSFVVEVASNDGYLLQNFVKAGIPCLGVEPTESTAERAISRGIPTLKQFFGEALSEEILTQNKKADLIIGNNVFAHVPDINDFTKGLRNLLSEHGTITLEFPHIANLLQQVQFDTVYHEHYSYFSLTAAVNVLNSAGLKIYDVDEIGTHGGSLRIYATHSASLIPIKNSVSAIIDREVALGITNRETYVGFQGLAEQTKNNLVDFLLQQRSKGMKVCGFGAAAKGNTFLNFAGVKKDLVEKIYDSAQSKQSKYMPGSHIPIKHPEELRLDKPDFVIIFPWNIAPEIISQHDYIHEWGGTFVTAIPRIAIL
jgi:hypothetical protein